jgi:Fe-S-cluster containining protein
MYAAPSDPALWQRWRDAADAPAVRAAIAAVHRRIADAVADRQPRCDQSGRCCRFDAFGHDLYLTGLEIAVFLRHAPAPPAPSPPHAHALTVLTDPGRTCPYMLDRACTVHAIRPAGCRIFFCQPGTQAWQQDLYEACLDDVRRLHDDLALPYHYMEWLDGLAAARHAITSAGGPARRPDLRSTRR